MNSNFLKLNTDKTNLKLFNFNNINTNFQLQHHKTEIKAVQSVKLLGTWLNGNLDMKKFIAGKVKTCHYHLKTYGI